MHDECGQIGIVELLQRDRGQVTVVGDDAQSIYGFLGADHRSFTLFEEAFGQDIRRFLTVNYRYGSMLSHGLGIMVIVDAAVHNENHVMSASFWNAVVDSLSLWEHLGRDCMLCMSYEFYKFVPHMHSPTHPVICY